MSAWKESWTLIWKPSLTHPSLFRNWLNLLLKTIPHFSLTYLTPRSRFLMNECMKWELTLDLKTIPHSSLTFQKLIESPFENLPSLFPHLSHTQKWISNEWVLEMRVEPWFENHPSLIPHFLEIDWISFWKPSLTFPSLFSHLEVNF